MKLISIGVVQPSVPHYRAPLFLRLKEDYGENLFVYTGESSGGGTIKTSDEVRGIVTFFHRKEFFSGRLVWDFGLDRLTRDKDLVILCAGVRQPAIWLTVIRRKLRGQRTVGWGHARGKSLFSVLILRCLLPFLDGFIAYTQSQERELRRYVGGNFPTWSAFNACLSASDCFSLPVAPEELTDFVYVGRLVEDKKPRLLLEAFILGVRTGRLPVSARLILAGDGPIRKSLQAEVEREGLSDRVLLPGGVYEINELRQLYRTAVMSVSPGYVGLSITQSLGFGVPMIIAEGEFHSPEIEAAEVGINAVFFPKDNADALCAVMCQTFIQRGQWLASRETISQQTARTYSYEKMYATFTAVIERFS